MRAVTRALAAYPQVTADLPAFPAWLTFVTSQQATDATTKTAREKDPGASVTRKGARPRKGQDPPPGGERS